MAVCECWVFHEAAVHCFSHVALRLQVVIAVVVVVFFALAGILSGSGNIEFSETVSIGPARVFSMEAEFAARI